jgi:phage-related protein
MYRIRMYRTQRGGRPVEEYLSGLEPKHRRKIAGVLELLAQEGPNLRRPYADVLEGPIRELRVGLGRLEHRVLYYLVLKDAIVLLHAFLKKTDAVPLREIDVAKERMKDLNGRLAAGEELE